MDFWRDKKVVVAVSGGIAAYKCLELIRRLRDSSATITGVVVTPAALKFVTPLSLAALAEAPVYDELFSLTQEREMGHIRLAREADLVIVAPATADLMARMAHGHGNDLLTTLLLARRGPVLLAPAMNSGMWESPATQRNVAQLVADGLSMVGPASGALACGETGVGRMSEPEAIMEAARRVLTAQRLAGRKMLITAGPTREAVDPARYISNRSSGRMGYAIAHAAVRMGAQVTLVHGPTALVPPEGVQAIGVESAQQMYEAVTAVWPQMDVAVMSAAVSDYRPKTMAQQKLKKKHQKGQSVQWELTENPDILAHVGAHKEPGQWVVGFAAETENLLEHGQEKRQRKGCDLLVINDVSRADIGFDSTHNEIVLLGPSDDGIERWSRTAKSEIAERLICRIADCLEEGTPDERR
ncbi:bifunctional phosphopantothenoylcysteine decarboxylase/phosphopantothenate--cysteine ligase CoaBC [Magnetococcus sp. PR-3]|uniref:bifunctional phosphopantothenoylcysteine decarboxylase/phosphopantothenate--cysteine ligase CoaBC n=1 Tax=Magnetococcus sp. PR-3 TaxID=3120355 RepID=UPI002FCDF935